jgi:hypothetical protein
VAEAAGQRGVGDAVRTIVIFFPYFSGLGCIEIIVFLGIIELIVDPCKLCRLH